MKRILSVAAASPALACATEAEPVPGKPCGRSAGGHALPGRLDYLSQGCVALD